MRRSSSFLASLLLAPALLPQAPAQQGTASLEVRVTDDSGAAIPGASVALSSPLGRNAQCTADQSGRCLFPSLPVASYRVHVSWPGFGAEDRLATILAVGRAAVLSVPLHIQVTQEAVTVHSDAPEGVSTDPASNAGAVVLTGKDLDALPDDPDELAADLKALAGPSAGLGEPQLFVDGFSGGRLPSKESIREVRVNQNPFSAEFDRLGFGRTEIFTKPGSERFHGLAFWKFSDAAFNSRNPYAPFKPAYQNRQLGGNVSGPLWKHASAFLDFEQRSIDNNAVVNATGIDPAFHIVPVRTALTAPQSHSTVSARVDQQLSTNHTLVARFTRWDSSYDNSGVGAFALPSASFARSLAGDTLQLTETAVLGARAVNETRFQYSRIGTAQSTTNTGPVTTVLDAFTGGVQTPFASDLQNRFEIQNYTSLSLGAHMVKFGARLRSASLTNASMKNFDGQFLFAGGAGPLLDPANQLVLDPSGAPLTGALTSIERYRRTLLFETLGYSMQQIRALGGGPSQFLLAGGQPQVSLSQLDAGLFLQDDWRLKPNLTLSAGLRWEVQNNVSDWTDIAPRLAVAWAPGGHHGKHPKTVIRAGAGVFYDRIAETLTLDALRFNGVNQQQYLIHDPNFFPAVPPLSQVAALGQPSILRQLSPQLRAPYVLQTALGVERQLPLRLVLGVNFIGTHGLHLLRSRNVNAPLPPTLQNRPFPGGDIYQYESSGLLNQQQIVTSVNRRFARTFSVFGYYAYGRMMSNTDGPSSFPMNQYNLAGEYGRAAMDIRHRAVAGGAVSLPFGLHLSPFLVARSGAPFDIVTGRDANHDGLYTDRPAFAAGPLAPGSVATPWGLFNIKPGPGASIVPRNFAQGPAFFSLNFRLSRAFGFGAINQEAGSKAARGGASSLAGADAGLHGILRQASTPHRYNITLSIQARNILNHVNPGLPVGNLSSALFGQSTWLASSSGPDGSFDGDNRRIQLQLRFTF